MNLCQGKGCDIRKNSDPNSIFGQFYECEICNKHFCINCMYLICCVCNNNFTCFWCGSHFKHTNNISYLDEEKLKCIKCSK